MFTRPGTVILFDEPDAHLELLRQREIFRVLCDVATRDNIQLIIATHSEVVMDEAATRGRVIAFVGKPHSLTDRGSHLKKALTRIGWDQYYQAEIKKWVLYCEGATDLEFLKNYASLIHHAAEEALARPFVKYVGDNSSFACEHFYGLREAVPDLIGVALYDRVGLSPESRTGLIEIEWKRREIENYLRLPEVLFRFADTGGGSDMFALAETERQRTLMERIVKELVPPIALKDNNDPFWVDTKITDEFLDRVFRMYYAELNVPAELFKGQYYRLAGLMLPEEVNPEIVSVLDKIYGVAITAEGL